MNAPRHFCLGEGSGQNIRKMEWNSVADSGIMTLSKPGNVARQRPFGQFQLTAERRR
ncbi:MAG: hypothetical protein ACYS30_04610 [Planctomycetota bacterium]